MRTAALVSAMLTVLVAGSGQALAQDKQPLPAFAADLRGFSISLGRDPVTASDLGLTTERLPSRGVGGVAGVHVYPWRGPIVALGIGAEWMTARGRAQQPAATDGTAGAPVHQRLSSLSPQLSLNFGHREGWSYLTAGMGRLSFVTFEDELPAEAVVPTKSTINMGGGARWFLTSHVAFTFDVRFYLTRPEARTALLPGRQRARLAVLSAGLSFK